MTDAADPPTRSLGKDTPAGDRGELPELVALTAAARRWLATVHAGLLEASAFNAGIPAAVSAVAADQDGPDAEEREARFLEQMRSEAERWASRARDFNSCLAEVDIALRQLTDRAGRGGLSPEDQAEADGALDKLLQFVDTGRSDRIRLTNLQDELVGSGSGQYVLDTLDALATMIDRKQESFEQWQALIEALPGRPHVLATLADS
jgi:hypothetical protein